MHSTTSRRILTRSIAALIVLSATAKAQQTWDGETDNNWNTLTNWSGNALPGGNATINIGGGGNPPFTATISAGLDVTPVDIFVGDGAATNGLLRHSAGTAGTGNGNWMFVGISGGTGTYNLTGTTTVAPGTLSGFDIGGGSMNVGGANVTDGRLYIGRDAGGNGTVNVNTTGTLKIGNDLNIALGGSTGVMRIDAGTVNRNSGWTAIGVDAGSNGTFSMSGGTVTGTGETTVGRNDGTGTLNVSGGSFNTGGWMVVAGGNGNGTINVSGTGLLNVGTDDGASRLELTNGGSTGTGTLNLNGGTALVNGINDNTAGTGTSIVNLNGGTLRARAGNGTFMEGLTRANVRNGGAKIDTNGFNITIGQALLHSDILDDSATDGGLTKNGSGTLTLSGANTYTGATTISAGTLQFGKLVSMPASGAVAVNTSSTLAVNLGGTGEWTTGTSGNGTVGGLLAGLGGQSGGTVTWTGAVKLGLDTTNGGTQTYSGTIADVGTSLGLTKLGAGTLVLNAANTYSGGTTVSAGRIEANNNTALGSGAVSIAAGANVLLNANSLTIANNFTLNGTTSGGALVSGNLGGGNVTTLSGTITLAANSNIASFWNDKQLTLSGKITGSGSLTFDRATALGDPVGGKFFISGATNDYTGSTTVNGRSAGALFGFSGNAILQLGAANALPTGTTLTLNNANLSLNGFNQTLGGLVASTSGTTVNSNGILNYWGGADGTVLASQIVNGSATPVTLTVNNAAANTFAGVLGGSGTNEDNFALTKGGAGPLTLSGANTYTGPTTVNAGTLEVQNDGTIISGRISGSTAPDSVKVNNGGTLLLSGSGDWDRIANTTGITLDGGTLSKGSGSSEGTGASISGGAPNGTDSAIGLGTLTLSADSTLDFGTGGVGTLTFANFDASTFTLNILNWSGTASGNDLTTSGVDGTHDRLIFTANLNFEGFLDQISFNGVGAAQIDLGGSYYEIVPIPEPSTTGLIGAAALLGLIASRERRRLSRLINRRT